MIITLPKVFTDEDLSKSNKVVAFEVSFGDQNQSIFKGVQLDQSTLRNTSESFVVLENLARSESGSGVHNVDISLFDYYRQASYSCEVTMMGNVMIQPTMFFYLKNIPIFNLEVPTALPGVHTEILDPRDTYTDSAEWTKRATKLAGLFIKNFEKYTDNEEGKVISNKIFEMFFVFFNVRV